MTRRSRKSRLAAATAAASRVKDHQVVGLGSGSTTALIVEILAERIRSEDMELSVVPSSMQIALKAEAHSLDISPLAQTNRVDITLDSCDEVDHDLRLIKGGGGALVNERLLASLSDSYLVVADEDKFSERIGTISSIPVETTPTAARTVVRRLEERDLRPRLRTDPKGYPVVSENGNLFADFRAPGDWDPDSTFHELRVLPGVLDVGIFLGEADEVFIGEKEVQILTRQQ